MQGEATSWRFGDQVIERRFVKNCALSGEYPQLVDKPDVPAIGRARVAELERQVKVRS